MKKILCLSLLFSVVINAMESDSAYPGHQARQATTDRSPISQTNFSQEVIERAKKTNIFDACEINDIEVVKYFIANGSNVDKATGWGQTPLHWAAYNGYTEICQFLIAHGADPNKADRYECTPLHLAAQFGYTKLCQLLIAHGADVNKENNYGNTPLHLAAIAGYNELFQFFIAQDFDVNKTEDDGYTPLHLAAQNGHTKLCQLLIAHDADPFCKNKQNKTPLEKASTQLKKLMVEMYNVPDCEKQKTLLALFPEKTAHDDAHTNQN